MNQNDRFNCRVPITAGNPRNLGGFSQIGFEYVVTATSTSSGPGGRSNAYSFEVLGSAEGLPIGTIRTAQIPLISGSKETLLEYVARVEAAPQGQQDKFGVTKVWTDASIPRGQHFFRQLGADGNRLSITTSHQRRQPVLHWTPSWH